MKEKKKIGKPITPANQLIIEQIKQTANGVLTSKEIAAIVGSTEKYVQKVALRLDLPRRKPSIAACPHTKSPKNLAIIEHVKNVADGKLSSKQIAAICGSTESYVCRVLLAYNLPRLAPRLPMYGDKNPSWVGGRMIDLAGYVHVKAPTGHPFQINGGRICEHRLVMEKEIGRYLKPEEVVDHIDSVTIHNHPSNLRLFPSNADHLKATISGQIPNWSAQGIENMKVPHYLRPEMQVVDTHHQRKERGEIRLRTILRAWLSLDKDSPYLLGTHHWLEQAGIFDLSRSSLEHRLQVLNQQYS